MRNLESSWQGNFCILREILEFELFEGKFSGIDFLSVLHTWCPTLGACTSVLIKAPLIIKSLPILDKYLINANKMG